MDTNDRKGLEQDSEQWVQEPAEAVERLRSVVNNVVDGIITIDHRGTVTTFNPASERIFGYAASEVVGQNVKLLMPEPYHGEHDGYLANFLRTGQAKIIGIGREVIGLRKDGFTFPMDLAVSDFRLRNEQFFTGIVRDITERKRAEAELRETEERMRSVINHVVDGIISIDDHGTVTTFNPAAERIFGYVASEVVGQNVKLLMPEPYHGEHDGYLANYLRTGQAKIIGIGREVIGLRKDGSTFPMDLAISDFTLGKTRHFTGIVRDITERKQVEESLHHEVGQRRRAEAALRQAHDELERKVEDRTAELGRVNVRLQRSLDEKVVLLKEIHHRVKNNLQIVSTLLDLQSDHTQDRQALEMFKESRGRVKSMALIHERLYRSQDLAHVNFVEYTRQLADDLYRTYKVSGDEIILDVDVDVPPLPIDIAIPCGLLLNELMSNCLKHAFKEATEGRIRVALRGGSGNANVLTVTDTGAGFPPDFDFRNTTSFGMQLVNTLVEQLNGRIEVKNSRGTEITVTFPDQR